MRKFISVLMWILFALVHIYPLGFIISAYFEYSFRLMNVSVFAIVTAVLSIVIVLLDSKYNNVTLCKINKILSIFITPFSLFTAAFCVFAYSKIWVFVSGFVCVGCCCYITIKYCKPFVLKLTSLIISALLLLPIGFASFIALIFGNFGQNTVVQTVESPSGKYYAQVIDSDQGALGGNTFVDVYEKSEFNLIVFRVEKKPQRVYSGQWGVGENMQIYWKDNGCIIINSVEYEIE